MTGNNTAFEQVIRAQLRFTGSEELRDTVGNTLIKPQLRREFARRSFYLYLRTENPVNVTYTYGGADRALHSEDPLDEYNAGIAQRHKGKDLYAKRYKLSSRVIGGAEYEYHRPGISLLFQVALGDYEKQRLLSPPFDDATAGPTYVTHEIHQEWLNESNNRSRDYVRLRAELGAYHPEAEQSGYLPDQYYITHPEGVVWTARHRDIPVSDDPAA